jgi:hypothetical protein
MRSNSQIYLTKPALHAFKAARRVDLLKGAQARASEKLDPHPIVAPLAWMACFAFGAAFWFLLLSHVV